MAIVHRRLTDLWVVGREITLDDGQGEPVTIWLQKLNPVEATDSSRRCDAARARMLSFRTQKDSAEFQANRSAVLGYGGDDIEEIVRFLVAEDRARSQRLHEASYADDEEWKKDNYLQGLHDAWEDGLRDTWARDHDDEDAKRVHDEMARFDKMVSESVDNDVSIASDVLRSRPNEELEDKMTLRLMEMDAGEAWLTELQRCQIWYGTREANDHKKRYFNSRAEVDELSAEVFTTLRNAYAELEVDASEGKGLRVTPPSSPSLEPAVEEVTESSAGLVSVGP